MGSWYANVFATTFSMSVLPAGWYVTPSMLTPWTGAHCVPEMLTSTCCIGTTTSIEAGGAPVPL